MKPDTDILHPFILRLRGLLTGFGVIVSAVSLVGFLGRFHWVLDLCSHFRVQYVISLTILGGMLLALRGRKRGFALLFLAVVNAIPVLPLFFGGQYATPKDSPVLRVMLLNVNTSQGDPRLVKEAIQEANPDILVLEEISARWMDDLAWLKHSHPYSITQPREDNFGIGLFCKQPLAEGEIAYIGSARVPSILATLRASGSLLRVIATHPTPPTSRDYSRWRDKQLDQLPTFIGRPGPTILVGDLNVTPWNSHFRRLLQRSGLMDSSRGRGFHPTWPNDNPFLRIPIDHILHSPDVTVVGRRVGRDVASDHYPVVVDFFVSSCAAIGRIDGSGNR